jgi:hypothetical protein
MNKLLDAIQAATADKSAGWQQESDLLIIIRQIVREEIQDYFYIKKLEEEEEGKYDDKY